MSTAPSVVVFDVGGVLSGPPFDGLEAYGLELGLVVGTLSGYFRGDPHFAQVEVGEATVRDYFSGLLTRVEAEHGVRLDLRKIGSLLTEAKTLRPEMLVLAAELAETTRVAVLTNNVAENDSWLVENLPASTFGPILNSATLKLRKPDPAIYVALLAHLGVPAHEVVFVDDFVENLPPAAALGIHTVLFESEPQCRAALQELGLRLTGSGVVIPVS